VTNTDIPGLPRPWRTDAGFLNAARAIRGEDFVSQALQSPWGQVGADFGAYWELWDSEPMRLQREIADEACRVDIECHALSVASNYPAPVYDVSQLEPGHPNDDEMLASDQQAIDRAVRYLDMRGLLFRPFKQAQFVTFKGA
jgi:hypothetical protein